MNETGRHFSNAIPLRILAASVAAGTVIAANVLMLAAQPLDEGDDLPARPAAITGIEAPTVASAKLLGEYDFVVPVLDRPEIHLPELAEVEASRLLGNGVMAAPSADIRVEAPAVDAMSLDAGTEAPAIRRPEALSPPPVQ